MKKGLEKNPKRRKSQEKVITKNPTYIKKKKITKEEGARQNPRLVAAAPSPSFFFSSSLVSNQPFPPHDQPPQQGYVV